MLRKPAALLTSAILMCVTSVPALAQDLSRDEIRALILETIRENPEIVSEALSIMEERAEEERVAAARAALVAQRELLEQDPNAPVIGHIEGDVTVVEFFDYNCPYCRRAKAQVDTLLARDQGVRVVMREWPILGEESVFAARAALASRKQGKYEDFHNALMELRGRATQATVMQAAESVGLDIDRLRTDMNAEDVDAHIATSMELARSIGFSGTPSFVIGDTLVPGYVDAVVMQSHVTTMRDGS